VAVDLRRRLPPVDELLRDARLAPLQAAHGRPALRHVLRGLLDEARACAARGDAAALERELEGLPRRAAEVLARAAVPSLRRVLNATGVIVHTNLGRAPLPGEVAARVAEVAAGYSNLEYDLLRGDRGDREVHAESRLRALLGAAGSVVVNNNAAAVLLAVNTLAEGREVLVSRGELVEIGGSFRIPDVIRKAGARLREVGTTNRTRLGDYRAALSPDTALLLKIHPSNFRIVGFTEAPTRRELAALAAEAGLPLVEDQGSGLLTPCPEVLGAEEGAAASLAEGVDLVTFSGDKLLGGPQAGLAAGQARVTEAMRRNPLYRALRVDKMTLAALEAVLALHESGAAAQALPVLRMLHLPVEAVAARAEAMARRLRERAEVEVSLRDGTSAVGGGAAPLHEVPTRLLAVAHPRHPPDALAAALRAHEPPVVARVADGRLLLDLRTVEPEDEEALLAALCAAVQED
jgi:L-seryl-tRNA(Ser) seleniumtransferase